MKRCDEAWDMPVRRTAAGGWGYARIRCQLPLAHAGGCFHWEDERTHENGAEAFGLAAGARDAGDTPDRMIPKARLRVLRRLAGHRYGTAARYLADDLGRTHSTTSGHLHALRGQGLVERRWEGRKGAYRWLITEDGRAAAEEGFIR